MFFIMGSGQNRKQLNFDQLIICKCCQRYGHIQIIMTYSYFSFFFIPIFKWGKRYFAKMSCCGEVCELNSELGKDIERGRLTALNEELLFQEKQQEWKYCQHCGFSTPEEFEYCPKCGQKL